MIGPGMLSQFSAIIALKFLLFRRLWFRSTTGVVAGAAMLIRTLIFGLLALGCGVGLFLAGWQMIPDMVATQPAGSFAGLDAPLLLLVADGLVLLFLFLWGMGLMLELQRSDIIDFGKLLYLPISLKMVFLLNFAASLASPAVLFFGFGVLGFSAGLALGIGPRMLWVLPLALAFYVMLAAWTYHLRGLLAILMENKRRRRLILTLIPFAFVLLAQLPNVVVQGSRLAGRHGPAPIDAGAAARYVPFAHQVLPPAWLPLGLAALAAQRYSVAASCLLGMGALAGLGLTVGYRSTHRHYTGARRSRRTKQEPAARVTVAPVDARRHTVLTARELPLIADDTAAMALASWLSAVRHPQVRIQIVMPLFFGVIFMAPIVLRSASAPMSEASPLVLTGILFWVVLAFAASLFNQFGMDPEAFQGLLLLPTPRYKYLLGRNLAFFVPVAFCYVLFAVLAAFTLKPGVLTLTILSIQFLQVYLSFCALGNFASIWFPYRLRRNALRGPGNRPELMLLGLLLMLLIPLMLLPTLLCLVIDDGFAALGYFEGIPMGLLASLTLLALTAAVYRMALRAAGRLLQTREQQVLGKLLKDKE